MRMGSRTMLPALVAVYLVVSFAAPSGVAAVQQWVRVLYTATYHNDAGGELFLPGGTLDPADLLDGVGANTKLVVGAFVSLTRPGAVTGTVLQISNGVEVAASVAGKKKPKVVAKLKGNLVQGVIDLRKTVPAKKLIDKGMVTFDMTTSGPEVAAYNADVSYYIELASLARSRR